MQAIKRRVLWTLLALIPIVCALAIGWRGYTEIVQQQQNHALIEAVKHNNVQGVMDALAHGAAPNARDIPQDKRRLWQRLLDFLHSKNPNSEIMPSALQIAVLNDMSVERLTPPEKSFAIIKALHDAGAIARGDAPKFLLEAQGYAKAMAELPDAPVMFNGRLKFNVVAEDTKEFLEAHGMSAYAYAALARCDFLWNDYSDAIHTYRIAQLWLPNDAQIQAGLAQAEAALRVKNGMERQLHDGSAVISMRPFPDETGRHLWAVAYGGLSKEGGSSFRAAVALYAEKDGGYTRLCESSRFDHSDLQLSVVRATGRRLPEIVVTEQGVGEDAAFSSIYIYEVKPGQLRSILSLVCGYAPSLVDLRHEGRYEAGVSDRRLGRWSDSDILLPPHYYAFNGSKYVFADRDYPEPFRDYIPTAQAEIKTTAYDYMLYYRIGYAYAMIGNTQKADEYYHKAEQSCRKRMANAHDSDTASRYRTYLKQILARVPEPNF